VDLYGLSRPYVSAMSRKDFCAGVNNIASEDTGLDASQASQGMIVNLFGCEERSDRTGVMGSDYVVFHERDWLDLGNPKEEAQDIDKPEKGER